MPWSRGVSVRALCTTLYYPILRTWTWSSKRRQTWANASLMSTRVGDVLLTRTSMSDDSPVLDPTEPMSADIPFLPHMLTPGSSLHPTFLLLVDLAFIFLFLVLLTMAWLTTGRGLSSTLR